MVLGEGSKGVAIRTPNHPTPIIASTGPLKASTQLRHAPKNPSPNAKSAKQAVRQRQPRHKEPPTAWKDSDSETKRGLPFCRPQKQGLRQRDPATVRTHRQHGRSRHRSNNWDQLGQIRQRFSIRTYVPAPTNHALQEASH